MKLICFCPKGWKLSCTQEKNRSFRIKRNMSCKMYLHYILTGTAGLFIAALCLGVRRENICLDGGSGCKHSLLEWIWAFQSITVIMPCGGIRARTTLSYCDLKWLWNSTIRGVVIGWSFSPSVCYPVQAAALLGLWSSSDWAHWKRLAALLVGGKSCLQCSVGR